MGQSDNGGTFLFLFAPEWLSLYNAHEHLDNNSREVSGTGAARTNTE
jgi:hypothetical protein